MKDVNSVIAAVILACVSTAITIGFVILCFAITHWIWFFAIPSGALSTMFICIAYQEYNDYTKGDK